MAVEARLSATWKKRFLLLIVFMTGTAAWFLYDGAVKYPELNRAYAAHQELIEEGRGAEWKKLSEEKGWPLKPPHQLYSSPQQYFFGGLAASIAVGLVIWTLVSMGRVMRSEDEAFYSSTGQRVGFDEVRRIDMKKWDSKGIAIVHYDREGKTRRVIVDDYKYEGAGIILDEIKAYQTARGTGSARL